MLEMVHIGTMALALFAAPRDAAEDMASALPVTAMGASAEACSGRFIDIDEGLEGLRATAAAWPSKDIAVRVEAAEGVDPACVDQISLALADAGFARIYLPDGNLLPRLVVSQPQ